MWNKHYPHDETEPAKCPVCRTILGTRDKNIIFKAHCVECRATFRWQRGDERPSVVMDRDAERRRCGCLGCGD